eukprot:8432111-Alexandrium_andersonii.AAC.1
MRQSVCKADTYTALLAIAASANVAACDSELCEVRSAPKSDIPEQLREVLLRQGRWDESRSCVKFVGGNQAAESEWGRSASLLAQKAVHRGGGATRHSTAHACSALVLSSCPGLVTLGAVMTRFFQLCCDKEDPGNYLKR